MFFAKTEAVSLAEEKTKQDKEATKQLKLQNKFRKKMAKLGVPIVENVSGATDPAAPDSNDSARENSTNSFDENVETPKLPDGVMTNINILQKISRKDREKQSDLNRRINDLLVGKGAKKAKKMVRLQETGEKILREIDPTYSRPRSGDYSLEAQKVVARAIENTLPKETIESAQKGDTAAEIVVVHKIEEIYGLLECARNNLYSTEIRRSTRGSVGGVLGPIFRGSENRGHRKGLSRFECEGKFEKERKKTFGIEDEIADDVEGKDENVAWKPKGKIGKVAYYGTVAPWLAHRGILRPIKIGIDAAADSTKKFGKFIWNKTFGKGFLTGSARTALWVGGSIPTGGIPVIPAAVEGAIWAGKKMKLGEKSKKVGGEATYIGKNVANIGTLGIPRAIAGLFQKLWEKVKLPRKVKKENK